MKLAIGLFLLLITCTQSTLFNQWIDVHWSIVFVLFSSSLSASTGAAFTYGAAPCISIVSIHDWSVYTSSYMCMLIFDGITLCFGWLLLFRGSDDHIGSWWANCWTAQCRRASISLCGRICKMYAQISNDYCLFVDADMIVVLTSIKTWNLIALLFLFWYLVACFVTICVEWHW